MINKILKNIRRFGFAYTFVFLLQKLGFKIDMPLGLALKRQRYFDSLSVAQQKKELCEFYKNSTGKTLDLDEPKAFSQKLQWLKFNDSTKEKALLSDKYEAAKIIAAKYEGRIKVVKQLGVWTDANDIDFAELPNQFALKCNHGSAMNIIVKDKSKLNIKKTIKKLNGWLRLNYATMNGMFENHYSFIEPKIIAEEFIQEMDGNLHDYKFHCFNGQPKFCQLIGDRIPNSHHYYLAFYTPDWKKTDITYNNHAVYQKDFEKPQKLDQMLQLAKEMSAPFSYVRVDFYLLNGNIYFGELTFTPDSGIFNFNDSKTDLEWGQMLKI